MRRAVRAALPNLAHWFGLRPADLDDMTDGEVRVFLDALEIIAAQVRKGSGDGRR